MKPQSVDELNQRFGLSGALTFDEDRGLARIRLNTASAQAAFYLQGAHCTAWKPAGSEPVLFLSRLSDIAPGKAIRGGIPIVFPWFAADSKPDRINGHPGPSHGFARIQDWTVEAANRRGQDIALRFTLGPTEMSRSMGFDGFLLVLDVVVGSSLQYALTVRNTSSTSLAFEEAFHSYFQVTDVHEANVTGLEKTSYIDKTDGFKVKGPSGQPIRFTSAVDRVYLGTAGPCVVHDELQRREIRIEKTHSLNTVVFNPYRALPDLGEWDWQSMLCVETANVGEHGLTLEPGASATMGMRISVSPKATPGERIPRGMA